jgi:hypothetical protein
MLQISKHPLYKKHDIDSAMKAFMDFYKSRFLTLFLSSFVMSLIVQYGATFIDMKDIQAMVEPGTVPDVMAILEKMKVLFVPMLILSLVGLLFSNILHYYILNKPLDESKNIFVSAIFSLKYFIPYLIILVLLAFIGSFIIVLGIMVFIIGVIFSIIYLLMVSLFILPLMMTEGINIGNTIARTVRFSHKGFWNNMAWTSVFVVLFVIISLVLSSIVLIPFAGSFLKTIMNPDAAAPALNVAASPLYIILSALVNGLTLPFIPIFGYILYFNGRAREDYSPAPVYGDETYKVRVEDLYARPIQEENKKETETE